jgi:hypothetical protein
MAEDADVKVHFSIGFSYAIERGSKKDKKGQKKQ